MRMWKPPHIPDSEEWATNEQIVVKRGYRRNIRTAHEIPLTGHLEINKICENIFTGPELRMICGEILQNV